MAIFLRGKSCLLSRLKSLSTLQRLEHTLTEQAQLSLGMEVSDSVAQHNSNIDISKWKKINAKFVGVTRSMIPSSPWIVLKILRSKGFEAYLVGGCVRDLLLNRIPKDFDVITTAKLKQVKKQFNRCEIVGRRFPICRVHVKGSVVEVSSFETVAADTEEKEKKLLSQMPGGCHEKDFIRWRNSMHRDFTINSLFFDPFMDKIYDYANGMADIRSLKLRTLIPAHLSFQEDCARILRGLRIAGRLGLSLSKDTEIALRKLSSSVKDLDKGRIMMEMNYMLSYGAAETTICLLRRFKLLDIFLPFHAAYLNQQAAETSATPIMLMKLFFNLDKLVGCDRPCDCTLWIGLLALHQALVSHPQDALVIWVFASVLYHGKWKEGVQFARENAKLQLKFSPEISGFCTFKSDEELAKEVSLLAVLVQDSVAALVDKDILAQSMYQYPDSPSSGLVFVSKKIGNYVAQLFDELVEDVESIKRRRESFMIDYFLLGKGNLHETRFVLGKVILETLSAGLDKEKCDPKLSDLIEAGKDKSRIPSPSDSEQMQEIGKKQKLESMKCTSGQEVSIKKEEMVLKDESQKMAKKLRRIAETTQSPEGELNRKKRNMFGEKKHQDMGRKHTKVVEKVKHHQLQVTGRSNLTKKEIIKLEEEKDCPGSVPEVANDKAEKLIKLSVKEKSSQPLLSKLFR